MNTNNYLKRDTQVIAGLVNPNLTQYYAQIRNSKSNTCITYKGNNLGVVGQVCDGSDSQTFFISKQPDSTYVISHNTSKTILGVQGSNSLDGTIISSLIGDDVQTFKIMKIGDKFYFQNVGTRKCIDLDNGNCSDGTKIQQMSCTQSPSELWWIEKVISYNPVPVPPSDTNLTVTEFYNVTITNFRYRNLCATYKGNNVGLMGTNCTNSLDQIFSIYSNNDNTYTIKHFATGLVWEIPNANKDNGTPVWSNKRNSSLPIQKFTISKINNAWIITNTQTSKCVDMDCRTFKIDQWDCRQNSKSQMWLFSNYSLQVRPLQSGPNGNVTITVDNTLVNITINGIPIPLTGSGDVTNFNSMKVYPISLRVGDKIAVTGTNTGGPAGIIGTFVYTDANGAVQILNTDSSWICGNKNAISLGKNGVNTTWPKFEAINANAEWIWNSYAQIAGDTTTCTVQVPN